MKNQISKRKFWGNPVVEISFLKFSQPAAGENFFGKNTIAEPSFPDEKKKKLAETSFDWNLIFPQKTKNQKKQQ